MPAALQSLYKYTTAPLANLDLLSGTVAGWVRGSAFYHSEWMVPSSNPGEGRIYFYSWVGDGVLSVTHIDGYVIAINNV